MARGAVEPVRRGKRALPVVLGQGQLHERSESRHAAGDGSIRVGRQGAEAPTESGLEMPELEAGRGPPAALRLIRDLYVEPLVAQARSEPGVEALLGAKVIARVEPDAQVQDHAADVRAQVPERRARDCRRE